MKKKLLLSGLTLLLTVICAFLGYLFIIFMGNYVLDEEKLVMDTASKLTDIDGNEITKLYIENRELVDISEIPDYVQQAFISVEDQRFYEHYGIDVQAIGRALYKDILAGGKVEGGSTITQQLAKNIFLTNDKTLLRKTKEAIIAINLEKRYSKSKLLEMYLNQVYFGHGAYGIKSAAKLYFNKDVSELTLEEGALLAGIPKAPSNYSPIANVDKSKDRRNVILSLMGDQKYITYEEVVRTQGKTVKLQVNKKQESPWLTTYIDMVFDEAKEKYALSNEELLRGGYTITVPLQVNIQKSAYELFQKKEYFPGTDAFAQGAFILLDNKTGGVIAAIGGRDYVPKGLNRLNVTRQPGSTFKPIAVYAPSIETKLFHPYSMLKDERLKYGDYEPENYDNQYAGKVSMFDAIVSSKNAAAVWTLSELGIGKSKEYLNEVGISIKDEGLAIALGGLSEGVTPIQMANAYRTFTSSGNFSEHHIIQKITNREGKIIAENLPDVKQVYSPQTAWDMTRMLQHVVSDGTAKNGVFQGEIAGKTGTTSYSAIEGAAKDAWFVGFTENVVGALWMGYDKTDQNHYLKNGSSYATKLFKDILTEAKWDQNVAFKVPEGVNDLDSPIRIKDIEQVDARYTFKPLGLITLTLEWEAQRDERVEYRIYEQTEKEQKLVGKVTGEGVFEIPYVNVFSNSTYKVAPYNVQTHEEGEPKQFIKPSLFTSN
ncbi:MULTISPECIES: transglycosylase domain-containing protein [Metabacillus]|uniref:Penicillin-binding protein n=2 Tax=Metabacillus TaxID=2675233 RepID=A0A179SQE4_9BACI|nr:MULTISPECIES: PBP1A family penicillin-binding protein [Metabacillus]OAS83967.1 penicillin-binding protein [Metabacillus litoralis]QNF28314.1 PBP1A family penicillin-binding protein [Metabacillus sp. KUDC1714]